MKMLCFELSKIGPNEIENVGTIWRLTKTNEKE